MRRRDSSAHQHPSSVSRKLESGDNVCFHFVLITVSAICACRQHQQGTPEADEAKAQHTEQHQQQPGPLLELYPGSSPAYLNHVLHDICHDRLEVCGLTPATVHLSDQCCVSAHPAQSQACRDANLQHVHQSPDVLWVIPCFFSTAWGECHYEFLAGRGSLADGSRQPGKERGKLACSPRAAAAGC